MVYPRLLPRDIFFERDYQGDRLEALTGIPRAHSSGVHLRLPGWSEEGPTLEIFNYDQLEARPSIAVTGLALVTSHSLRRMCQLQCRLFSRQVDSGAKVTVC